MTVYRSSLLEGQVALVTGGGTGIGLAVARELAGLGAKLVLAGRREEVVRDAAASFGDAAIGVACDTRDPEAVSKLVEQALERFSRLDVLVNNAGGQFPSPAALISPKGFEAVVRNNLLGTWNVTQAVASRAMIPAKSGCIVNVTAQVARGFPGMAHTGAARAGVENLTKSLAVEWAMHGIRVNAVAPGTIKTSGTVKYGDALLESARKATPMKRLGTAEEVASLIVYLALPIASFITGQTYTIDGGSSLWGDMLEIPG